MKKIFFLISIFLCMCGTEAHAKVGEVIGHIYSTDIKAFINDVEVQSYAIDGKSIVVVEDIMNSYSYDDDSRTLQIGSFAPYNLINGKTDYSCEAGMILGDIYETDIKTYVYNLNIPAYALNGKTAVALEDIGYDQMFSEIGGKYIWDGDERKISLEMLYDNKKKYSILNENHVNITININDDLTKGSAIINEIYHCDDSQEHFKWPKWVEQDGDLDKMQALFPINADVNDENNIIGYYFSHPLLNNKRIAFTYYFTDKLIAATQNSIPLKCTINEIIEHYNSVHAAQVKQRFDTDYYTFAYMEGPYISYILLIYNNGSYHDFYDDLFKFNPYNHVENIRIDEKNEKVYLTYDVDYIIDLKTSELKRLI